MIGVTEAFRLLMAHSHPKESTILALEAAQGRVLAEDILADRPFPPYDRVMMDGIALAHASLEKGTFAFPIEKTQAAGEEAWILSHPDLCVEVMTGAICPIHADTVIPLEDLDLVEGLARVQKKEGVRKGQFIHRQGSDKLAGALLLPQGTLLHPLALSVAAAVGKASLRVWQFPKTIIISSGDELVPVEADPKGQQVRISNTHALAGVLGRFGIRADTRHFPDDVDRLRREMPEILKEYSLVLLSGGVSAGKFDFFPMVLREAGVQTHFHKIAQRPGKPFLFGTYQNCHVFAFPGNPVSTMVCALRYLVPWLQESMACRLSPQWRAKLRDSLPASGDLTVFAPVRLSQGENDASLWAIPLSGNGSGDFTGLLEADGFLELPGGEGPFGGDTLYSYWPLSFNL